jgi:hypothetical protein
MPQRSFEPPPSRILGGRTAERVSRRHPQAPFEHVEPLSQGHGVVASRKRPPSMASDTQVLSQWLRHGFRASDRHRCAANALQFLDPRPRRRPLALALGDERLELGAGELGHVGADRLSGEGWTFHYSNVLPAACQKSVSTLSGSGI